MKLLRPVCCLPRTGLGPNDRNREEFCRWGDFLAMFIFGVELFLQRDFPGIGFWDGLLNCRKREIMMIAAACSAISTVELTLKFKCNSVCIQISWSNPKYDAMFSFSFVNPAASPPSGFVGAAKSV